MRFQAIKIVGGEVKMPFQGKRKGLTLVELALVMSLMTLFALLVIPMFSVAAENARVKVAVREIIAVFRYAHAKALSLGRPVLVEVDRTENTLQVLIPSGIVKGGKRWGALDRTEEEWRRLVGERLEVLDPLDFTPDPSPMGRKRHLPQGVAVTSLTDAVSGEELNLVAFYPDGTASGVQVIVAGKRSGALLRVAPLTGTVTLEIVSLPDLRNPQ